MKSLLARNSKLASPQEQLNILNNSSEKLKQNTKFFDLVSKTDTNS